MNFTAEFYLSRLFFLGLAILGVATSAAVEILDPTSAATTKNDVTLTSSVITTKATEKQKLSPLRGAKTKLSENDPRETALVAAAGVRGERRLGVSNKECILFQVHTEFGTADDKEGNEEKPHDFVHLASLEGDGDSQSHERTWACQFDKRYALKVLGLSDHLVDLIGVPYEYFENYKDAKDTTNSFMKKRRNSHVESGKTVMRFKDAMIDRSANTLYVDLLQAKLKTPGNAKHDKNRRRLAPPTIIPTIGEKKTLVVRLAMADAMHLDSSRGGPGVSSDDIRKYVFENPVSLKKKYEACSYNKLKIMPFEGRTKSNVQVHGGIVTIELPRDRSDELKQYADENEGVAPRGKLVRYAREAAESKLGDLATQFDFVMFCLPEEMKGFHALALLNRYDSYYTSPWCTRPSFQLHEVGHNMGMDHAGEISMYDDKVGYMGFSYDKMDGPNMCFNPSNNYYLGWYEEQADWYDPYAFKSKGGKQFVIVGVDDFNPEESFININHSKRHEKLVSKLVVLQLYQVDLESDFYIGYNRGTGINVGTSMNRDEIVIVERIGRADQSAETKKIGTLKSVGDEFEIKKYNGKKEKSVFVLFESKLSDGNEVVIRVSTERHGPPDRSEFLFKGKKRKNCAWVGSNPEKRCSKSWIYQSVGTYWCPATCAGVDFTLPMVVECRTAQDLNWLKFQSNPKKNCDWVKQDLDRCKKSSKGEKISTFWCPKTCHC